WRHSRARSRRRSGGARPRADLGSCPRLVAASTKNRLSAQSGIVSGGGPSPAPAHGPGAEPGPLRRRARTATLLLVSTGRPHGFSKSSATARPEGDRSGGARTGGAFRQPAGDVAGGARAARQHRHVDREPAAGRGGLSAV